MSNYLLPIIVLIIVLYGIKKNENIYDLFIEGSREGFSLTLKIFPSILSMIFAVNIFLKSGILDLFNNSEIISLLLIRPLSSNASLGILNEIFKSDGPDTILGFMGSIIQGCTDTTFYIIALYFGSIGIKKTRYCLPICLLADLIGGISAIILAYLFF